MTFPRFLFACVACWLTGAAVQRYLDTRPQTLTAAELEPHIHISAQPVIPDNRGWPPGTLVSTAFKTSHLGTMYARKDSRGEWVEVTCSPEWQVPFTFFEPGGRWRLACEVPSWMDADGGRRFP